MAVVTKPFTFEGSKRMKIAESGIEELAQHVDSLIVILNDKLEEVLGEDVTQEDAFTRRRRRAEQRRRRHRRDHQPARAW